MSASGTKETTMNVSVLLGHPYEQSFNAAIAVAVVRTLEENGHTVRFHDLYGDSITD